MIDIKSLKDVIKRSIKPARVGSAEQQADVSQETICFIDEDDFELLNLRGRGIAMISCGGGGSTNLRLIVDGAEETCTTDSIRVGSYKFNNSIKITAYNTDIQPQSGDTILYTTKSLPNLVISSHCHSKVYDYYKLTIPSTIHNDYGCVYPITLRFALADACSFKAYKKYSLDAEWVEIPQRTQAEMKNGVEGFRVEGNKAFLSVRFSDTSDEIYVKIEDENGDPAGAFVGITKYYDNKRCAVIFTADDSYVKNDGTDVTTETETMIDDFQERELWITPALITGKLTSTHWSKLQAQFEEGYVEVAAHSRTHPSPPYSDYDSEIGGCKDDIIANLDLTKIPAAHPNLQSKGTTEYVWAWMEPYGESDSDVRTKLGQYKYLVDRSAKYDIFAPISYPTWNPDGVGTFGRNQPSLQLTDTISDTDLNSVFDKCYSTGGIYFVYMHPTNWYNNLTNARNHADYIKGKADVWYVGAGHCWLYQLTRMNCVIYGVRDETQEVVWEWV